MTIDNKLGKEKILLDKDELILAYYELDELYIQNKDKGNWGFCDKLNKIILRFESATGYQYFRTLKKKEPKKEDDSSKK